MTPEACKGRTYIVTGANTGLGSACVIMGVRNLAAGYHALLDIETSTAITDVAQVWELDLCSHSSVVAFAKRAETLERIDAVIENAGVAAGERILKEGHLITVTVNVFSTFLLGVLLLPKLKGSREGFGIVPHLVVVMSTVSFDFKGEWMKIKDDPIAKIDGEVVETMMAYPLSKLLEIMAVRHLSTLLPMSSSGLVINLVCPGLCKTDLSRSVPPERRERLEESKKLYGRTAEDGSRTLLFGAVAGEESHGSLFASCTFAGNIIPSWVTGEEGKESQKLVWDVIASELEMIGPGCVEKILQQ